MAKKQKKRKILGFFKKKSKISNFDRTLRCINLIMMVSFIVFQIILFQHHFIETPVQYKFDSGIDKRPVLEFLSMVPEQYLGLANKIYFTNNDIESVILNSKVHGENIQTGGIYNFGIDGIIVRGDLRNWRGIFCHEVDHAFLFNKLNSTKHVEFKEIFETCKETNKYSHEFNDKYYEGFVLNAENFADSFKDYKRGVMPCDELKDWFYEVEGKFLRRAILEVS